MIGEIFQLGYLVPALEPAMAGWTRAHGVGPFFVLPVREFSALWVDGEIAENFHIIDSVALSYAGDIQIELIVPTAAPSTYRRFLDAGRTGLHHLGVASHDYDADRAAALARGATIETEGHSPLTRFAYLDGGVGHAGSIAELIEMRPAIVDAFARIKEATHDWDGADPVRHL